MGKLNDTFIRNLKPTGKSQKHFDGEGLFLFVTEKGTKSFRIKYYFENSEKLISLGKYPVITLAQARKNLAELKHKLSQGIDPSAQKKAVKESIIAEKVNAFEVIAREWHEKNTNKWKESHAKKLLGLLTKNIFPTLGKVQIDKITPQQLLEAIRRVESRGYNETAHRTLQACGQVFRYAIATGRATRDISFDLKGALESVKTKHYPTLTNPHDVGNLLRKIDAYNESISVQYALKILPYVFLRSQEIRKGRWDEINFEKAEWKIPAERMKIPETHIVPLSTQVIALLKELKEYTGHGELLFPSPRILSRPISAEGLIAGLRNMGYSKDELVIHSFRSIASTILNEHGYNRDHIERQLAHAERDNIRASYNYAQYLPERRKMMQEFADYLDELRKEK